MYVDEIHEGMLALLSQVRYFFQSRFTQTPTHRFRSNVLHLNSFNITFPPNSVDVKSFRSSAVNINTTELISLSDIISTISHRGAWGEIRQSY